ncbi:MAG: asparagine synthase (glutamine-hydrolyzing), partial [Bacteroidota bacterium]
IIYNGEIYNYIELRQYLISRKVSLRTHSDTEVILRLYMLHGEDCLQWLNGIFAFAIYDREAGTVFLARDHFGVKPLYYFQQGDRFVFGSEIKSVLAFPGVPAAVDNEGLEDYMTFQFVLGERTLFDQIRKLEPANYLVVKDGRIVKKAVYWEVSPELDYDRTEDQFADELLVTIDGALNFQTRSDVPVGAYLSGGVDSSLVSILARKNYLGEFHTFTGRFDEGAAFDESGYARLISEKIRSSHHEVTPTWEDFREHFEKLVWYMDEPAAGPGLFPQYMVSKLASEHVTVVLGGQGGDELFGGYARYYVAYLEQCLKGAIFETQEEGQHIITLGSMIPNLPLLKQYTPMLKRQFSRGMFEPMDQRYFQLIDRSPNLDRVFTGTLLDSLNFDHVYDRFRNVFAASTTPSYLNKMISFDFKTLLPALFHVEDRVSMAVSIESRVPLLDKRVVELAAQIPPAIKFKGGRPKSVLMNAIQNILPREIIERKDKMGFPTPINQWFSGPLKSYVMDIFNSQAARERGIYRKDNLEKMISEGKGYGRDVWGALNLEVWFKTFIDK